MQKKLEKEFKGPEWVKGGKGGLLRNHYDLMALMNAFFHLSLFENANNSSKILLNICLHCSLTSFNNDQYGNAPPPCLKPKNVKFKIKKHKPKFF